jgi:uncharacterized cupin superfamily protein
METVDESELEWESTERGAVEFRRKRLGGETANDELGCSLYEIPSGKRGWPYHYHTGNTEAIYVLDGEGELRGPEDEREPLEPGVYAVFPSGPEGVHQLENEGDEPLRYLAISTMNEPDVLRYPDSDTVGIHVGEPPGGDTEARLFDHYFRMDDAVDYWEDVS